VTIDRQYADPGPQPTVTYAYTWSRLPAVAYQSVYVNTAPLLADNRCWLRLVGSTAARAVHSRYGRIVTE